MNDRIRKRTKYVTVSAMLSALGVLFLELGSLVEVLDISVAVLASILCVYAVIEIGGAFPWLIWTVTSILGFLLVPQKTPVLFYAFALGFYPIIKEKLERCSRVLCYILKLIVFHVCLGVTVLVMWLFFPAMLAMENLTWMPIALYGLCLVFFVLYDLLLTRMITFYLLRLRNRFRIK